VTNEKKKVNTTAAISALGAMAAIVCAKDVYHKGKTTPSIYGI
jgi:hypothetical protein